MKKQFIAYWFFTGSILLFFLLDTLLSLLHDGQQLFSVPGDLLPVLIIAITAVFFKSRIAVCSAVMIMVLTLAVRIANYISLLILKSPLTYPVFRLLSEHTEHASLAAVFGPFYYAGVILLLVMIIALLTIWCIWSCRSLQTEPISKKHQKFRTISLCTAALLMTIAGIICRSTPGKTAFAYVADIAQSTHQDYLRKHRPIRDGYFPDEEILNTIRAKNPELLAQNAFPPGERLKKYNRIIVIAVESLDLEFIHAFNPAIPADATPYLDSLAARYPVFRNYFAGSQPTSYAFTSMLLSRVNFDDDLRLRSVSLNDELRKAGWKSIYISPTNGGLFDNKQDYTALFRFDKIFFMEELDKKAETKWGLTDATLFDCAAKIIKAETAPRSITFISTMDLHNPYMRSGPAKEHPENVPFLAALRCTDANLQTFITRLQSDPQIWNDQTLILLTADHSATHGANYTNRKDFTPARIPLFVLTAKPLKDLPLEKYCSSLDLPATLLHQSGMQIPQTFMGQDIFTKKSFALAWSGLDKTLYMHTPVQTVTANTPVLKAFYTLFYGPE